MPTFYLFIRNVKTARCETAYEMKNNQLLSLHDPEYGIRWDTLSDVSVDIQQKFFAIYEAGQQNQETEEGCSSEEE